MMESPLTALFVLFPRLPRCVGSINYHQEARIEEEQMQQEMELRAEFWGG